MNTFLKYTGVALVVWFMYQKLVNKKSFTQTYDESLAALKSCCKKTESTEKAE